MKLGCIKGFKHACPVSLDPRAVGKLVTTSFDPQTRMVGRHYHDGGELEGREVGRSTGGGRHLV
jgi:hypothetical protein